MVADHIDWMRVLLWIALGLLCEALLWVMIARADAAEHDVLRHDDDDDLSLRG